jgi:hypothetical protein
VQNCKDSSDLGIFLQWENTWTRSTASWTSGAAQVHGGLEVARTRRVATLHQHKACERSGSPVLIGDGRERRGRLGMADGELTGARAMMVRRRDGGGGRLMSRWR